MPKPDVYERKMIDVLDPELKKTVKSYYIMEAFKLCGCTREDGFKGQGVIPLAPMKRVSVFKTSKELGTYNHHPNIAKWNGEYWFAWDNCMVNQEWPGQRTFISHSKDGLNWSDRILVADGDEKKGMLRNIGGLYPYGDKLYAFIQEKWDLVHATGVEFSSTDNTKTSYRNDIWETSDGINWRNVKKKYIDVRWMFENPSLTNEGRLMGPITTKDGLPAVTLWPGDNPMDEPEIIPIPYEIDPKKYYEAHDPGVFCYGEATWYTDDDNRIWMWHRDESASNFIGIALSCDGGESWTEVMRSNFPDSTSRICGGRLTDGRFYMVGNSTRTHMDRNFFAISLSDDGAKFGKMYKLVNERTTQRFPGHLKGHGYQYPSCLVDEDKLLIGYSVNKEDIEVGILDTKII
ncbi:MAG: exo-alpha-sialidase [Candidatus Electryonea clarkiae]|nr:exo-alpha-sialidase [Candidatus Electryonea clarkiae]